MTDRDLEIAFLLHEPIATWVSGKDNLLWFYRNGRFSYVINSILEWTVDGFTLDRANDYAKNQGFSHLVGGV